jgi:pimeloyl-ACP methyl ester carboxylesterase
MNLTRITLLLAIACVLVLAAFALFQNRLLYFPAKASVADLATGQLKPWPAPQDFRGLVAEPSGVVRGTAIVFHGNAGHAGHRDMYADALTAQGLRVILAEYPGYGPRDGALGEQSLVADAVRTIALAHGQYGAPVIIVGESLGAGVAAAAAARQQDKVASLLLITPWDRLEHVAAYHYPWLPVGWLLRDKYDSTAHLAAFKHPVMVVLAELDSVVPARLGLALHQSMEGPKRLWVVKEAGHNDWAQHVDAAWWRWTVGHLLGAPFTATPPAMP